MAILDAKIAEAEKAIAEGETTGEKRRAMERREDLMRLKRVEQIYVRIHSPLLWYDVRASCASQSAVLPVLSGWVLVLLKLLLATVSTANNGIQPQSSAAAGFPPGVMSREYCAVCPPRVPGIADRAQRSTRHLRSPPPSTRQM